ncbi:MAG: ABC transporter permease [Candidatus Dormibacteraceae bacterium]
MLRYTARRILQSVVVLFIVTAMSFFLLHLAPGDPVDLLVGDVPMTTAQLQEIRHFWGLDRPVQEQYFIWLSNMFRGDLGESVSFGGRKVAQLIADAAPATVQLNLLALLLSTLVAIPAGVIAALRKHSAFDAGIMLGSVLGISLPGFWLGLMLIVLFSLTLRLLPPFGQTDWRSYVMPVFVLATEQTALLARMARATMLEVLDEDYVRTARAKGLRERGVIVRHALRNALLPIVTILGYRIGFLLSGTIVIETVFGWPGVGRLLFAAIGQRDYVVVQAITLLGGTLVVVANLVTDLSYAVIDPRIRNR